MAMTKTEITNYKRKFNEEKYDRIGIYLPAGEKDRWKASAALAGLSMGEFIRRCVNEKIREE